MATKTAPTAPVAPDNVRRIGAQSPLGQTVLVLQGGGALGAYQAGVYQAMHAAGIEPDWIVGTSIGAINGAIIMGKTVTTEFANRHPGPTTNPHNPAHTPGGSSSGSAAAVADFQVTLATGTQTGGSVIRPAAFCGVIGYKPTFGHFPVAGMKANTEWLDTIGAYARSLEDIALFRAALAGIPHRPVQKLERPPRIAICFTPHKDEMQPEGIAAIEEAAASLAKAGAEVTEFAMPPEMLQMREAQKTLSAFDGPRAAADDVRRHDAEPGAHERNGHVVGEHQDERADEPAHDRGRHHARDVARRDGRRRAGEIRHGD